MCVMSMIMDHYGDRWNQPPYRPTEFFPNPQPISPEEIKEFRELLERARKYDQEHNQPDCEVAEKRQKLLDLAEELGIDISFVND